MSGFFHPLSPIVDSESHTLILGSFPSLKSFELSFYYAHPQNQFWRLLSAIYEAKAGSIEEKTALLSNAKIALWDAAAYCERINSSDSNLKNIQPNDIEGLLSKYPDIKRIFFTGRAAQKIYKSSFSHLPIKNTLLPSPSPAYAAMSFEAKLEIWKGHLE